MSIVTFYNSSIEQTGKTMSIAAIATYMAIEHNYRILVISTTNKEDALKRCFLGAKKEKEKSWDFWTQCSFRNRNRSRRIS